MASTGNHKRPRVLCIEDERDFRENIVEFLSNESFDVIEAHNAQDGMKYFHDTHPDIVLCDVQMPGMSGLDMLNKLREHYPSELADTRFMFLSALGDKEHMLSGYNLGCDDYIVKPIDYDLLLAKLNRQLERNNPRSISSQHSIESIEEILAEFIQIHLQRPLHGLVGYSELLSDMPSQNLPAYLERLKNLSNDQLQLVRMLSTTMYILANRYDINYQDMKISSLLWEACVTALGYDAARQITIESEEDSVVRVDGRLYHLLLDRFIRDVCRYTQKPLAYELKKDGSAMVLSCYADSLSENKKKNWMSIEEFIDSSIGREALAFHGITVSLALAIERLLEQPIRFAAQSESAIAMQVRLPVV